MFDEVAVSIVVNERVAMRLRGQDRVEAVRRLAALGVPSRQTLDLLRWNITSDMLGHYRARHGIPAPVVKRDGLSRRALGLEGRVRAL